MKGVGVKVDVEGVGGGGDDHIWLSVLSTAL